MQKFLKVIFMMTATMLCKVWGSNETFLSGVIQQAKQITDTAKALVSQSKFPYFDKDQATYTLSDFLDFDTYCPNWDRLFLIKKHLLFRDVVDALQQEVEVAKRLANVLKEEDDDVEQAFAQWDNQLRSLYA